jgi:DNA-directed RNA polymerase specialized sigma24 family protein
MPESDTATELHKIANLLALRAVEEKSKGEAAMLLAACGFATKDIAALLGTSEGSVRGLVSQGRKKTDKGNG